MIAPRLHAFITLSSLQPPVPPKAALSTSTPGPALLAEARAHWQAGRARQAERLCRRALAKWPDAGDPLHALGLMAHSFGQLPLALALLRQACALPWAQVAHLCNLAEFCRQACLFQEGEQAARRALALDDRFPPAWTTLGILLHEAGRAAEGIAWLERAARGRADAEAHSNLGNAQRRIGRWGDAERSYRRALALQPDLGKAIGNHADLLRGLGRLGEAETVALRAILLDPTRPAGHLALAAVETERRQPEEALRRLDALLAFAPAHPPALGARAGALLALDQPEEALTAARMAVAGAGDHPALLAILGRCLGALSRMEEALAALGPPAASDTEPLLLTRANLLLQAGRLEEGQRELDRLIERFPDHAPGWLLRGDTRSYGPDSPDLARLEAALGRAVPSSPDRMVLHFAAGKACLDAGRAERAFHHFAEGNRLKRASIAYDAETTSRWMTAIADAFPPERLQSRRADLASERPVFVVGMPRSGTTLVEQVLASHPRVRGAGELTVLQRVMRDLGHTPAAEALTPARLHEAGQAYLQAVAPLAGDAARLIDKMPLNLLQLGLIALALPGARVIHVRRDPVDTCLSCYTRLFEGEQNFTYDMAELGRFYGDYRRLMAHWRNALPPGMLIEVDYEAMVRNLERETRRLLDFCGLEWDDECLSFHHSARTVRSASLTQVRRPLYASSVGRWKSSSPWLGPLLATLEAEGIPVAR